MTRPEVISMCAVVISLASFAASLYTVQRDRARVKATSRFIPASEQGDARVWVTIVNAGRRPVILRLLIHADSNGGPTIGSYVGETTQGIRLGENERHEELVKRDDLIQNTPDDFIEVDDVWFEDSLGRKHRIKDSRKNIELLRRAA